jgi:hypothetical protein
MNTKFVLASVFAAVSGLAGIANTAKAGTDIHINFGLIARPVPVVVAPAYCAPATPVVIVGDRREGPRGYWKAVVVKTWVPARWVVSYVSHGREVRRFEPGYFAYDTDRVWVDFGRDHDRRDYRRG